MALQGIDISKWQANNWQRLIDTYGTDFVIMRATFGRWVDTYCDTFYQYAKSKGKKLGFYLFPLTSEGSPEASAEWHYNQVKGYIKEAIPMLDWEATNGTDASNVAWALAWLKKFEQLSGVKPIIYMNSSCERTYNWSEVVANDNGLWIANYGINDGKNHGFGSLKHWKFAALHQYTSLGDNGAGLDKDVFNGDRAAWDAYAGGKPSEVVPEKTPEPVKKTNEELAGEVLAGVWGNGEDRRNRLTAAGYDYSAVQNLVNTMVGSSKAEYYTVQPGDNLSRIAAKHGTTWQELQKLNGLQNPNLIYSGQRLRVK